jgi:hypothetical protein
LDARGRESLQEADTARFCAVEDASYDTIRRMAREAEGVIL